MMSIYFCRDKANTLPRPKATPAELSETTPTSVDIWKGRRKGNPWPHHVPKNALGCGRGFTKRGRGHIWWHCIYSSNTQQQLMNKFYSNDNLQTIYIPCVLTFFIQYLELLYTVRLQAYGCTSQAALRLLVGPRNAPSRSQDPARGWATARRVPVVALTRRMRTILRLRRSVDGKRSGRSTVLQVFILQATRHNIHAAL